MMDKGKGNDGWMDECTGAIIRHDRIGMMQVRRCNGFGYAGEVFRLPAAAAVAVVVILLPFGSVTLT
jgi:hypothetical protein